MIETSKFPEYRQAVDDFLLLGLKPGEVLPRDWLDDHLGIDPSKIIDEPSAKRIQLERLEKTSKFKAALLEDHHIYLSPSPGKGLEVISTEHQTRRATEEFLHGLKVAARNYKRVLVNTDTAKLADEGVKEHTDAFVKLAGLMGERRRIFRLGASAQSPNKSSTPRGEE